jgi:hypothetical protein
MAGTPTRSHHPTAEGSSEKHIHHGRTMAAWVGSLMATGAILIGGIALMMQNWPLFWVAAALLVIAVIATRVLQVMGHGAD